MMKVFYSSNSWKLKNGRQQTMPNWIECFLVNLFFGMSWSTILDELPADGKSSSARSALKEIGE
jgi:hypothetical protein